MKTHHALWSPVGSARWPAVAMLCAFGGLLGPEAATRAWDPAHTPRRLNEMGRELLLFPNVDLDPPCPAHNPSAWDPDGLYSEICLYEQELSDGAEDEDENHIFTGDGCGVCRCTRHFYNPYTEQGFVQDYLDIGRFDCKNALNWAFKHDLEDRTPGEGLTWTA